VGADGGLMPEPVESLLRGLQDGGRPLADGLAERMGAVLGCGLRAVRIHTGPAADHLNRLLGARAFTWGSDVFFGKGAYDPAGLSGRELIAHELIHVRQQLNGQVPCQGTGITVRAAGDRFEQEAEALAPMVAAAVAGGRAAQMHPCRTPRKPGCGVSRAIQRSSGGMVTAANTQPPPKASDGPHTCHEAALGWVLTAESYTHPWQLIAQVKSKLMHAGKDIPHWMPNIYAVARKISQADVTAAAPSPRPGDILFTKDPGGIWHSMVVVNSVANHVYIRGFNNAATFNYIGVASAAPAGAYDASNRDVADPNLWHGLPHAEVFGKAIGPELPNTHLWLISYDNVARSLKSALSHWTYSMLRTPGWQHTGGPQCGPHCPH
jgi:hypothetical protein